MHTGPIRFPEWKSVLAAANFSERQREQFEREIISFLRHCKAGRAAATIEEAKAYLSRREKERRGPSSSANVSAAREALRWFYREGARRRDASGASDGTTPWEGARGATRESEVRVGRAIPVGDDSVPRVGSPRPMRRAMEPPPAATDLGVEPWERDLIKAVRERGFLWRTEQTYREWAVRFARFVAPRSPYAAGGEEVAAFLSALAVEGRASPSAQKQAFRVKGSAHAVN